MTSSHRGLYSALGVSQGDVETVSVTVVYTVYRLYGSYENLEGGFNSEAMEDFTGGVTETFNLSRQQPPRNLFYIMSKAVHEGALIGCGILVRYFFSIYLIAVYT